MGHSTSQCTVYFYWPVWALSWLAKLSLEVTIWLPSTSVLWEYPWITVQENISAFAGDFFPLNLFSFHWICSKLWVYVASHTQNFNQRKHHLYMVFITAKLCARCYKAAEEKGIEHHHEYICLRVRKKNQVISWIKWLRNPVTKPVMYQEICISHVVRKYV